MLELKAQARLEYGKKLKKLRKNGKMPAVFYGSKSESTPITVDTKEFIKIWKEAGESSVISLETPNGAKDVLIQDVDIDPVRGIPRHTDFYVIDKDKKITVTVPVVFVGVSAAVKELNGTLVKVMHEIEIEVLPKHLPHELKADLSLLKDFESRISIKDIILPESAEAADDANETIALIVEQKEEEEKPEEAIDLSAIEVEKKGKQEDVNAETKEEPQQK